jgi:acyl carrier protein
MRSRIRGVYAGRERSIPGLPIYDPRVDRRSAETRLRDFITRELISDEDIDLGTEEAIFSSGLADSFAVTQLICFLEDQFGVRISPRDATLRDFDTVSRILDLLQALEDHPASR